MKVQKKEETQSLIGIQISVQFSLFVQLGNILWLFVMHYQGDTRCLIISNTPVIDKLN